MEYALASIAVAAFAWFILRKIRGKKFLPGMGGGGGKGRNTRPK